MKKFIVIFKQYKHQLSWIYVFMILTELSILSTPFLLGKSIDGLIIGNWYWMVILGVSVIFYQAFSTTDEWYMILRFYYYYLQ
jgi:hypothetical protein